jgi:hypothetical protein
VSAAINDRFVLNTLYQFDHRVDLNAFMGHNACFTAGADKVATTASHTRALVISDVLF